MMIPAMQTVFVWPATHLASYAYLGFGHLLGYDGLARLFGMA